jgi:hypothetical protein
MNREPFKDNIELYDYAKRNGLEIAWAYSPAFEKRRRMLSPGQFEIRDVHTHKGHHQGSPVLAGDHHGRMACGSAAT